jgi:hypothetical protein
MGDPGNIMIRITFTQKPAGSRSDYPAVGHVRVDDFGNKLFEREGYPKNIPALKCQRDYNGTGASQRISWIIDIPEGYGKVIALVEDRKNFVILYAPEAQTK